MYSFDERRVFSIQISSFLNLVQEYAKFIRSKILAIVRICNNHVEWELKFYLTVLMR